MKSQIQVVENSDRFHVSENNVPVYTFLFSDGNSVGVSKAFAQMNANSEAYKLALRRTSEKNTVTLLPQAVK